MGQFCVEHEENEVFEDFFTQEIESRGARPGQDERHRRLVSTYSTGSPKDRVASEIDGNCDPA
jgi:hypothetical protein